MEPRAVRLERPEISRAQSRDSAGPLVTYWLSTELERRIIGYQIASAVQVLAIMMLALHDIGYQCEMHQVESVHIGYFQCSSFEVCVCGA